MQNFESLRKVYNITYLFVNIKGENNYLYHHLRYAIIRQIMASERDRQLEETMKRGRVTGVSSLGSPDFDLKKFAEVEHGLHEEFNPSELNLAHDGQLTFSLQGSNGYILYAIKGEDEGDYRGIAFLKTHALHSYPMLVPDGSGFTVKSLNDVAASRLHMERQSPLYVIEHGGFFVPEKYRGLGYADMLAQLQARDIANAVDGNIAFVDDNGDKIDPSNVIHTIVAMGNLTDDPQWQHFQREVISQNKHVTSEMLAAYSLDPSTIGVPRALSKRSAKLAEELGLVFLGINTKNGGPLFGDKIVSPDHLGTS